MPIDLIIDLGNECNTCGFKYLPDLNKWSSGIITTYEFYVSVDNQQWKLVDQGEFPNIKIAHWCKSKKLHLQWLVTLNYVLRKTLLVMMLLGMPKWMYLQSD